MTPADIDLDQLTAVLDPDQRGGRRRTDDFAAAVHSLVRHTEPADVPDLILETIRRGEQEGRWKATRTVTVQRGRATLPSAITLTAPARTVDALLAITEPLRPEIACWAQGLRLNTYQRRIVVAANEWRKQTDGGRVPLATTNERAYELLGDEKAFSGWPPRGGATIWRSDRLNFDLLRCERVPTALVWEPVTEIPQGPAPMVCVENHSTYRTLLKVLRARTPASWAAVAWVQGHNTTPLGAIPALPFPVMRLDYMGDLDSTGLKIAATVCAIVHDAGIEAGPAQRLWALLLDQPSGAGRRVGAQEARAVSAWLPEGLREPARRLLIAGRRIPQEALRTELLLHVPLP
ncbi:hypothetical protein ACFU99_08900 [Streptomyces sp. NPDC057654]|uniref:hypothetical protein n=1 Tax=Streptomyces sp. NPDC057654 TaxID=3346196 RepID=UPI00369F7921